MFLAVMLLSAILFVDDASAHTLFVKPEYFVVEPQDMVAVSLIDGTFLKSENRLRKSTAAVEIIGPGDVEHDFANDDWVSVDKMSVLSARFAEPGNYLIGATTRPRKVSLDPETFNYYLRYEGLFEQKEEREKLGETETAAVEQYTKFAKAIVYKSVYARGRRQIQGHGSQGR
jgi:hypothetical protein